MLVIPMKQLLWMIFILPVIVFSSSSLFNFKGESWLSAHSIHGSAQVIRVPAPSTGVTFWSQVYQKQNPLNHRLASGPQRGNKGPTGVDGWIDGLLSKEPWISYMLLRGLIFHFRKHCLTAFYFMGRSVRIKNTNSPGHYFLICYGPIWYK